jgi:glucose/arabinose dehydrogenase
MKLAKAARPLILAAAAVLATSAQAQVNGSDWPILNAKSKEQLRNTRSPSNQVIAPEADLTLLPFNVQKVATYNFPWRLAFLPDGRMLITERTGKVWLGTQTGERTEVTGVPPVTVGGLGGMLGVFLSPTFKKDNQVYLTYSEPGDIGPSLAVSRGKLVIGKDGTAKYADWKRIWHDPGKNDSRIGGNFGAQIAFAPDGKSFFLTSGERIRMSPAQDPNVPLGKILHLTLDGKPSPDNPNYGKVGTPTMDAVAKPVDSEEAKTPKVIRSFKLDGPNLTPSETWTTGHRAPYGLAFGPDGRLWEAENGPNGGDELNLIKKGKNYGWPLVSYGSNYNEKPIPLPPTRPEFEPPAIYWKPVVAVGSLGFYKGAMFPQWNGDMFLTGLGSNTLNRIVFDAKGNPVPAERWAMGFRVRDFRVAPDGAIWLLEDRPDGGVYRLTPK